MKVQLIHQKSIWGSRTWLCMAPVRYLVSLGPIGASALGKLWGSCWQESSLLRTCREVVTLKENTNSTILMDFLCIITSSEIPSLTTVPKVSISIIIRNLFCFIFFYNNLNCFQVIVYLFVSPLSLECKILKNRYFVCCSLYIFPRSMLDIYQYLYSSSLTNIYWMYENIFMIWGREELFRIEEAHTMRS